MHTHAINAEVRVGGALSGDTGPVTASHRWGELEAFAFSPEFARFCLAQAAFVVEGVSEAFTRDSARHIAIDARRRRLTPADLLIAKKIAGCKRSPDLDDRAHWSRYHRTLHWLLAAYHAPLGEPRTGAINESAEQHVHAGG